jgi:transcriptional regulator with XRE-family HTH domain
MRLGWNHLWKSSIYRRATAAERRLIEIRFCVAYTLKRKRRAARLTQAALAARIGITRNTVSRIERASNRVSLDHAVRALIALSCTDAEIGEAFNPLLNGAIQLLRRRAAEPMFPKPRAEAEKSTREHRFPRTRALRYRDRTQPTWRRP